MHTRTNTHRHKEPSILTTVARNCRTGKLLATPYSHRAVQAKQSDTYTYMSFIPLPHVKICLQITRMYTQKLLALLTITRYNVFRAHMHSRIRGDSPSLRGLSLLLLPRTQLRHGAGFSDGTLSLALWPPISPWDPQLLSFLGTRG